VSSGRRAAVSRGAMVLLSMVSSWLLGTVARSMMAAAVLRQWRVSPGGPTGSLFAWTCLGRSFMVVLPVAAAAWLADITFFSFFFLFAPVRFGAENDVSDKAPSVSMEGPLAERHSGEGQGVLAKWDLIRFSLHLYSL